MGVRRGDIFWVDLDPVKGSEQGKTRPCVVIQSDQGNKSSPTTIVAPITSSYERIYPTDVELEVGEGNLEKRSKVLLNQIVAVDIDSRVKGKVGCLSEERMEEIDQKIKYSLGLF